MNPQLSATRFRSIRNRPAGRARWSIRNYPQPEQPASATGAIPARLTKRQRGQPIRLTTNEWYKAQQLGDSFWLYVVWSPLEKPDPVPVMIQNPARVLEHAAKPVVSARFWDIPAEAIAAASNNHTPTS